MVPHPLTCVGSCSTLAQMCWATGASLWFATVVLHIPLVRWGPAQFCFWEPGGAWAWPDWNVLRGGGGERNARQEGRGSPAVC